MKIIFENKPYKVALQNKPNFKIIDLLKRTLWGTKETLYQHQNTEENIQNVSNPIFFSLEKNDLLVGTCCFSKRTSKIRDKAVDFWYSRYFAIDINYQGGIFGYMILKHIRNYFNTQSSIPSVFYAFVDISNKRSAKLISYLGFQNVRSFETLTFSRLYPKKDTRVALLKNNEKEHMLIRLQKAYSEYVFTPFELDFFGNDYYVLKINNEIVAGLHVNKAHWVIRSLSGLAGAIIIKIIPHITIVSRLFNPKKFNFAAFDGIYCKEGYEKHFFTLIESVCADLKLTVGITWLDNKSFLYDRLKSGGKWGIMEKIKEQIPAHVVAAFKNLTEEEQRELTDRPFYISSIDII